MRDLTQNCVTFITGNCDVGPVTVTQAAFNTAKEGAWDGLVSSP